MKWFSLVYHACRLFLGILFLTSGIGKFYGDSGLMGPGWLFERLRPYGLEPYSIFIAVSELIIGYLLLVRRFATIGAVMLFPMLLNILALVITLHWQGTPYLVSFFLLMNCFLLVYDFHKLKFLVSEEVGPLRPLPVIRRNWRLDIAYALGLLILLMNVYEQQSQGRITYTKGAQRIVIAYLLGLSVWTWWKHHREKTPRRLSNKCHGQ